MVNINFVIAVVKPIWYCFISVNNFGIFNRYLQIQMEASLCDSMEQYPPDPPAMQELQETWFWSLGWEDAQKEGMATHSSILAWRIPCIHRSLVGYGL